MKENAELYAEEVSETESPEVRFFPEEIGEKEENAYRLCRKRAPVKTKEQGRVFGDKGHRKQYFSFLKRDTPVLKLAPVKISVLHFRPLILRFVDMWSEGEINRTLTYANPKLVGTRIVDPKRWEKPIVANCLSKTVFTDIRMLIVNETLTEAVNGTVNGTENEDGTDKDGTNSEVDETLDGGTVNETLSLNETSVVDPTGNSTLDGNVTLANGTKASNETVKTEVKEPEPQAAFFHRILAFTGLLSAPVDIQLIAEFGVGGHAEDICDEALESDLYVIKSRSRADHRLATLLSFLSTPEAGGHTVFPDLRLVVPATKGDAILWYNLSPSGHLLSTEHLDCPHLAGEKITAHQWLWYQENKEILGSGRNRTSHQSLPGFIMA